MQWCHTYILINQCLSNWQGATDKFWTWQKLMKLMDIFHSFIQIKLGNGEKIYTWFDNWHKRGPLVAKYGARIMYDAASRPNSKVNEYIAYIANNEWHFPSNSADLSRVIQDLPQIETRTDDCVV